MRSAAQITSAEQKKFTKVRAIRGLFACQECSMHAQDRGHQLADLCSLTYANGAAYPAAKHAWREHSGHTSEKARIRSDTAARYLHGADAELPRRCWWQTEARSRCG